MSGKLQSNFVTKGCPQFNQLQHNLLINDRNKTDKSQGLLAHLCSQYAPRKRQLPNKYPNIFLVKKTLRLLSPVPCPVMEERCSLELGITSPYYTLHITYYTHYAKRMTCFTHYAQRITHYMLHLLHTMHYTLHTTHYMLHPVCTMY